MKESEEQKGGEVEREEWYNLRFELRSSHIRETTFARVNTRLVAHVVSRYPTKNAFKEK